MAAYGSDDFVPLTFYLTAPYRLPVVDARFGMYGFGGTPSVMFDGVSDHVGGAGSGSMFATYEPLYLNRAATSSPLVLDADYTIVAGEAAIAVTATVDQPLPGGTNQLQFYVALADEHGNVNMVMAALSPHALTGGGVGAQETVQRTFAVPSAWAEENFRVVVLAQNLDTEEILQGAQAVPDHKASIVVDCEPDGVGAGWTLTGPYGTVAAGSGDRQLDTFYAGEFTLQWEDIPYWTGPAPGTVTRTVAEGGQLVFTGQYTDGPFAAAAAVPGAPGDPVRGVGAADFDGDGDADLHVLAEGAADRLLRNDGGAYAAAGSGAVLDPGAGFAAAWTDYDGDGHRDVYVGRGGETNLLLRGDGAGGFAPASVYGIDHAGQARAVSWLDYDNDGILDLYVVNTGGVNALLKGAGDVGGGLHLFTDQAGGAADPGNGRAVAWIDVDFDGRLDAYVVNAFQANLLLQNTALGFSNIATGKGIDDAGNGAGAAWGDYDNDGDWDLYVANDGSADRLYQAAGGSYNLVLGENLGDRGRARGAVFADLDNDTRLDLYVPRADQPDLLLFGDGAGGFAAAPVGWPEAGTGSEAAVCADVDGDGDLDVFVARDGAADVVFANTTVQDNHWLQVRLRGPAGNPDGVGALVRLAADGATQMRQAAAGGLPVHFGLGADPHVSEVEITWPGGLVQTVGPLRGDQVLEVTCGQAVSDAGAPVPAPANRLAAARPNPFHPVTTIDYALAGAGPVRLEVYSLDGRRVAVLVDREQPAGSHSAVWRGRDDAGRRVASGTYVYRLITPDGEVLRGRAALVK